MFKASSKCLELAVKMDQNQPEGEGSILSFEQAYMDVMHNRVNGYKTLTLLIRHPGMQCVLNLAVMEYEKENSEMISLFLEKFNEALADYKQDQNYKVNPYGIMCDENAAKTSLLLKRYMERNSSKLSHVNGILSNVLIGHLHVCMSWKGKPSRSM